MSPLLLTALLIGQTSAQPVAPPSAAPHPAPVQYYIVVPPPAKPVPLVTPPVQPVQYVYYLPTAAPAATSSAIPSAAPVVAEQQPVCAVCQETQDGFLRRFIKAYCDEFNPPKEEKKEPSNGATGDAKSAAKGSGAATNGSSSQNGQTASKDGNGASAASNGNGNSKNDSDSGEKKEEPEKPRRALPAPFASPPFPSAEWQGFPLIGVPPSDSVYPLMKALYGDCAKEQRTRAYGWVNASGNWSNAKNSNTVSAYWVKPDDFVLDQLLVRVEREVDSVQTDHIDVGFRSTGFYGIDYRYTTAGGWGSDQLLVNNRLYGFDPTEQYVNIYVPGIAKGMIITAGRWIATPDIEVQFAPDNYMASHSLLFAIDVYTETGVMATFMLDEQWTVQGALHSGADMAPWYEGAVPTGMFGVRWVSRDNCDSVYTVLNAINNAEFQYFDLRGTPAGHHNYNIFQSTWQHKFSDCVHTKTEAYIMWEKNAPVGGTPSIGPVQFNTGGGLGPTVPGTSLTYAVLNYTMFKFSDKDFITFRNEWTKDEHGTRYGFPGNYTGNAVGWSHNINSLVQIRPEIGYYRNWNNAAFDNGASNNLFMGGIDFTVRF